jgi:hypothetical protein
MVTIDSPLGPGRGINVLVIQTSRIPAARSASCVGVNPDFEPHVVQRFCSAVDAVGELGEVWKETVGNWVPMVFDAPAVIDWSL